MLNALLCLYWSIDSGCSSRYTKILALAVNCSDFTCIFFTSCCSWINGRASLLFIGSRGRLWCNRASTSLPCVCMSAYRRTWIAIKAGWTPNVRFGLVESGTFGSSSLIISHFKKNFKGTNEKKWPQKLVWRSLLVIVLLSAAVPRRYGINQWQKEPPSFRRPPQNSHWRNVSPGQNLGCAWTMLA